MQIEDGKIKDILLKGNYVAADDMATAERMAHARRFPLLEILLIEGIITRAILGQAVAESYGLPYADLEAHPPTKQQVLKTPEVIARQYRAVIFSEGAKDIVFATDNPPLATQLAETIKKSPISKSRTIRIAYTMPEELDDAFSHYRKPLEARFLEIIQETETVAPEIIEAIIEDSVANRASDIHFEPQENDVITRFRIDGVLQEVGRLPKKYYESILNRIKILAHLRTDEHRAAQDGAIRHVSNRKATDLRVSIVPTLDGEKVVIRLLSEYVRGFTLSDLGLGSADMARVVEVSQKPFGMMMVVGPTGSGKTTTLYGLLKILNRPEVNIATIEDPVEYKIPGVNHIQVDAATNLTFAKGLRSIVRQDPDIILVGEIRDKETAEIGVNAALTGHLLLSTFHANDASTAIPRLLDMGVEPFLLASTLELVIAQRLVRRICETCRFSYTIKRSDLKKSIPHVEKYFTHVSKTLYKAKGCEVCGMTGYKGRTALYELIQMTPEMQDLIMQHPSTKQIWNLAHAQGSRSMFEDGIDKVKAGLTTIEEVLRVASPE